LYDYVVFLDIIGADQLIGTTKINFSLQSLKIIVVFFQ